MLIYVKIIKKIKNNYFKIYFNFMIIYVNKRFFTDGRTTQNYSSEPHKMK